MMKNFSSFFLPLQLIPDYSQRAHLLIISSSRDHFPFYFFLISRKLGQHSLLRTPSQHARSFFLELFFGSNSECTLISEKKRICRYDYHGCARWREFCACPDFLEGTREGGGRTSDKPYIILERACKLISFCVYNRVICAACEVENDFKREHYGQVFFSSRKSLRRVCECAGNEESREENIFFSFFRLFLKMTRI